MPEREGSGDIDEAAAKWAARLDRGPLSPDEEKALDLWARADSRRQGALARALAISARFDDLDVEMDAAARLGGTGRPDR